MIAYSPGQRYTVVGKNGSGKTVKVCVLACTLVPWNPAQSDWQCWWLDTKHDRTDLAMLDEWGFRGVHERANTARRIFSLSGGKDAVYEQAQIISRRALEVGGVLLVYDEYNHVCKNRIDAGPDVEDVQKRGRGLDVGCIGGVQEMVMVPRYLFSQANHLSLFSLTHARDIKIARELNPDYAPGWPKRPDAVPHRHGYWQKYLDGYGRDGQWKYWRHVRAWKDHLNELS